MLFSPWESIGNPNREVEVKIDGAAIVVTGRDFSADSAEASPFKCRKSDALEFVHINDGWRRGSMTADPVTLHKRPGQQGPIDDVFMEPFLVVTPTGKCASAEVQKWVDFEVEHFETRWRNAFRGELRMKPDTLVTPQDIEHYHLILWGDPASNRLIGEVAAKLPFSWSAKDLSIAGKTYEAANHVPLAIYPNPLNANRYIVLNSGPTFRESSDHTNSLQNPKLPDWAMLDITMAPDGKSAGKVEAADFFDESWKIATNRHE